MFSQGAQGGNKPSGLGISERKKKIQIKLYILSILLICSEICTYFLVTGLLNNGQGGTGIKLDFEIYLITILFSVTN